MSSQRLLSTYGIPATVVSRLMEHDFIYDSDVSKLKPTELCSATGLTNQECADLIDIISETFNLKTKTALDIIEQDDGMPYIISFCEGLDSLLGGGFPVNAITEVAGVPGIGKTQLCLQLCVAVNIPKEFGGLEGEAIFIDTEGSFTVSRLEEMCECAIQHLASLSGNEESPNLTSESVLKKIHYFRCLSHIELLAVIRHLPQFMKSYPKVKLVVIDSVAFHYRHDFDDFVARTGVLCQMMQELIQLATTYSLAVVVTNQMTTRFEKDGSTHVVAALGETWAHCPTIRLKLFWNDNVRMASLIKAPHRSSSMVPFQVTLGGIRDVNVKLERSEEPPCKKAKLEA